MATGTAEVYINDAQAQNALKQLSEQADKLNKRLHEMKKANDLAGHDKAKKELDQVNKQMKAYTKTNQDLGRVLDNLSGASYNELVKVQRRLRTEMKGMKRDTEDQRKAFDAKAKQIKQVDKELSKMQGSMKGSSDLSRMFTDQMRAMGLPVDKFNKLLAAKSALMAKLAGTTGTATKATGIFSKALKVLRIALISTGIGAIVVAMGALAAALFSTQRGTDALNKVLIPLRTILQRLWGIMQELGWAMIDAFKNPKQAIRDLWEFLKSQIVNRIQGVMDMFTALGRVISNSLKLNFSEAGEAAKDFGNAYLQTMTGVEDVVGKAGKAIKGMGEEIAQAHKEGSRLAEIQIELKKLAIEQAKEQAELNNRFYQGYSILRDVSKTEQERIKAGQDAIKAAEDLQSMKMREIDLLIEEQQLIMKQNDSDYDAQLKLAQLESQRQQAETAFLAQTLRIKTTLGGLLKNEEKTEEQKLDALKAYNAELQKFYDQEVERSMSDSEREIAKINEKYARLYEMAEAAEQETTDLRKRHAEELANYEKELEERTQNEILEIKRRYGIDVSAELMEAELQQLQLHYDNKLLSEEEFQQAKKHIQEKYADTQEKLKETEVKTEVLTGEQKKKIAGDVADSSMQLMKEGSEGYKMMSATKGMIDAISASVAALSPPPVGAGPILGIPIAAAAFASGIANVAKIKAQQFASGKYDVIGADDGRTYSAGYTPAAKTGIYHSPTLVGGLGLVSEKAPEMVIDGDTLRNIQINYPAVIDAINMARVPQFAAGNYPDMPGINIQRGDKETQMLNGMMTMMNQMAGIMQSPLRAHVVYTDIKDADDEMDEIKNNVSK